MHNKSVTWAVVDKMLLLLQGAAEVLLKKYVYSLDYTLAESYL